MTACGALFDRVRETSPLVHCISNLVSANDCANIALALGALMIYPETDWMKAVDLARFISH